MNKTSHIETFDGLPIRVPNAITTETQNFYISYNNVDSDIYGCDTTALVKNNEMRFLILNGNHTKQYAAIIKNGGNYDDCYAYYKAHIDERSKYSEDQLL